MNTGLDYAFAMLHSSNIPLVLASTSPYRLELLKKLGLDFTTAAPQCDEDFYKAQIKDPYQLANRLAEEKASSLAKADICVIGGDQLVHLNGNQILGKPKTFEKAFEQLTSMQGKTHYLITAICVVSGGKKHSFTNTTEIQMRPLSSEQIQSYLELDQPFDCAGSYKIEKSGLTLIEKMVCEDFSAIQGIPLIQLIKVLSGLGYSIPGRVKPL